MRFDRDAEVAVQHVCRRRGTERVDADHGAVQPNVLAPVIGDAGFDRDALAGTRTAAHPDSSPSENRETCVSTMNGVPVLRTLDPVQLMVARDLVAGIDVT